MIEKMDGFKLIFVAVICLIHCNIVRAGTYTTTNNLFENSYTNNLIDMAQTQIENFNYKEYAIIQTDYSYYLIASDDVSASNNQITMNKASIIRATRVQENYNYYYDYSKYEEDNVTINVNNIVVSNINTNKSVSSSRYENYKQNKNLKNIGIFILGLVFAIFITKERNY